MDISITPLETTKDEENDTVTTTFRLTFQFDEHQAFSLELDNDDLEVLAAVTLRALRACLFT